MSIKYIKQINNQNFVFPNATLAEYDVDIVHDLNENSVSGTVNTFSATTVSSTGITITSNITWNSNGAELFIKNSGLSTLVTFHMLPAGQLYFKPWVIIGFASGSSNQTTYTATRTMNVIPSQFGLTTFTTGTYYFEVRFVGKRAIYPVCQTLTITI
jgi:hypothetical protein